MEDRFFKADAKQIADMILDAKIKSNDKSK